MSYDSLDSSSKQGIAVWSKGEVLNMLRSWQVLNVCLNLCPWKIENNLHLETITSFQKVLKFYSQI